MHRNWKSALYDYVQRCNRNEAELNPDVGTDRLRGSWSAAEGRRIQRLKQRFRDRDAKPLRTETRAKLVRAGQREDGIEAVLDLRICCEYEQRHIRFAEERMERRIVHLAEEDGDWRIHDIHIEIPERNGEGPLPDAMPRDAVYREDNRTTAAPYLNRAVLNRMGIHRGYSYNRSLVAAYADQWWNQPNPQYLNFHVNCTNYVSQCLFAGGAPMNYTERRDRGWWYQGMINRQERWSYSWAVSHSLESFIRTNRSGLTARLVESPGELTVGDVIFYDWDGNGRFGHSTIVTAADASGMPLVNANTNNSYRRYWDYRDSYAWTEQTRYRFYHITD